MFMCVCGHVCMSVWKSEGNHGCHSSDDIYTPCFLKQGLRPGAPSRSDCLGSEPERLALLHLPGAMIIIIV